MQVFYSLSSEGPGFTGWYYWHDENEDSDPVGPWESEEAAERAASKAIKVKAE